MTKQWARADNLTVCYHKKSKWTPVFHVCPVIDNEFHHNIVKVVCRSTMLWWNSWSITGQTHEKLMTISSFDISIIIGMRVNLLCDILLFWWKESRLYGDRSGSFINTILGCRNVVMTLQKLYVNHKIDAEEAKSTDTWKFLPDCYIWLFLTTIKC